MRIGEDERLIRLGELGGSRQILFHHGDDISAGACFGLNVPADSDKPGGRFRLDLSELSP